jgi:hypothetical protein
VATFLNQSLLKYALIKSNLLTSKSGAFQECHVTDEGAVNGHARHESDVLFVTVLTPMAVATTGSPSIGLGFAGGSSRWWHMDVAISRGAGLPSPRGAVMAGVTTEATKTSAATRYVRIAYRRITVWDCAIGGDWLGL